MMVNDQTHTKRQHDKLSRRGFIRYLWIGLISISILEFISVVIVFLTSGERKSSVKKKTGLKTLAMVQDIQKGSVTAFRSDRLYLVRMADGGLLALSLQCTHLGCAVTWNKDTGQFDCPCHASSFSMDGEVVSPPAPRALDTYPIYIEGGQVKVDLSKPSKRNSFNKSQLVYA